jgi:hypothetical protein
MGMKTVGNIVFSFYTFAVNNWSSGTIVRLTSGKGSVGIEMMTKLDKMTINQLNFEARL